MGEKEVNTYAKGFENGWNKCRESMCKEFNLNKDEVIAWECSGELLDVNDNSHEKGKELLHELLENNPKEINSQRDERVMYCTSQSKSNKRDMGNLVDTDDNLDEKEKKQ